MPSPASTCFCGAAGGQRGPAGRAAAGEGVGPAVLGEERRRRKEGEERVSWAAARAGGQGGGQGGRPGRAGAAGREARPSGSAAAVKQVRLGITRSAQGRDPGRPMVSDPVRVDLRVRPHRLLIPPGQNGAPGPCGGPSKSGLFSALFAAVGARPRREICPGLAPGPDPAGQVRSGAALEIPVRVLVPLSDLRSPFVGAKERFPAGGRGSDGGSPTPAKSPPTRATGPPGAGPPKPRSRPDPSPPADVA